MRVAILLAAGSSTRYGRADKLLAWLGGRRLVEHALRSAEAAPAARVIVTVPRRGPRHFFLRRLATPRVEIVPIDRTKEGLSKSLRAALRRMRPMEREAYIFLGDMPRIPSGVAGRLASAPARPFYRGVPGHPVLVARPSRAQLDLLEGDTGLRALIAGKRITIVPAGPGCIVDVDDRRTLLRLRLSRPRR